MDIGDLMLKKEEIPILYERNFMLPIHPALLEPHSNIHPNLASHVFPQAAQEWYEDLRHYRETVDLDEQTKKWVDDVFLAKLPEIRTEFGRQVTLISWEDNHETEANGFARAMSINRNFGGTIYFNRGDYGCRTFLPFGGYPNEYVIFSEDKAREFGFDNMTLAEENKGTLVYVYNLHNVDHYPGALFLRNWGMLYLNEALKSIL